MESITRAKRAKACTNARRLADNGRGDGFDFDFDSLGLFMGKMGPLYSTSGIL